MKRPQIKEIKINPVKVGVVIAFIVTLLATSWVEAGLIAAIGAYEWGFLTGDKR